jgi:hypothetical protein
MFGARVDVKLPGGLAQLYRGKTNISRHALKDSGGNRVGVRGARGDNNG